MNEFLPDPIRMPAVYLALAPRAWGSHQRRRALQEFHRRYPEHRNLRSSSERERAYRYLARFELGELVHESGLIASRGNE